MDVRQGAEGHAVETTEQHGRYDTTYSVRCSCGYRRAGFEYRIAADRVGRDHMNTTKEAR